MPAAEGEVLLVEIVEVKAIAHVADLGGGFVVTGEDVDLVGAGGQDCAAAVEAFAPGDLVAGGEIEIGFDGEELFQGFPIVVDVGENEELHGKRVAGKDRAKEINRRGAETPRKTC